MYILYLLFVVFVDRERRRTGWFTDVNSFAP